MIYVGINYILNTVVKSPELQVGFSDRDNGSEEIGGDWGFGVFEMVL